METESLGVIAFFGITSFIQTDLCPLASTFWNALLWWGNRAKIGLDGRIQSIFP